MEVLFGRNPILETLRAGRRPLHRLVLAEGIREREVIGEIVRLARRANIAVQRLSKHQTAQLVGHGRHQGVALEVGDYPYATVPQMLAAARKAEEPPFLLILDLLQDPQNVGSLLRTAEIVGVHGVVLQERRAVGVTPAVVNASSGATEHLLVAQVSNLVRALKELKEQDVWVYGLEGGTEAGLYTQENLAGSIALVVGSEGAGLRRLVRETCDALIRLPMRGRIESLNAAVAGSVALYAVWQSRGF